MKIHVFTNQRQPLCRAAINGKGLTGSYDCVEEFAKVGEKGDLGCTLLIFRYDEDQYEHWCDNCASVASSRRAWRT